MMRTPPEPAPPPCPAEATSGTFIGVPVAVAAVAVAVAAYTMRGGPANIGSRPRSARDAADHVRRRVLSRHLARRKAARVRGAALPRRRLHILHRAPGRRRHDQRRPFSTASPPSTICGGAPTGGTCSSTGPRTDGCGTYLLSALGGAPRYLTAGVAASTPAVTAAHRLRECAGLRLLGRRGRARRRGARQRCRARQGAVSGRPLGDPGHPVDPDADHPGAARPLAGRGA